MNRLLLAIAGLWPRRRRRAWRHVSARRRRIALALFTVVIVAGYGWWHFTNDRRVRRTAEVFLHRLTGASVRIRAARFGLFDGIRLEGVRLFYIDKNGRTEDVLEAREVLLRHRPAALLRGNLDVTRVICIAPVLRLTGDPEGEGWNYPELLHGTMSISPVPGATRPTVTLRDGLVIFRESVKGGMIEVGRLSLNASAVPQGDTSVYEIDVDAPNGRVHGLVDVATGRTNWTGAAHWLAVQGALPRQYRQLAQRYNLQGNMQFSVDYGAAPAQSRLSVVLSDVSLTLPAEEGGLGLKDLAGTIVMSGGEVRLENLTGRLVQWGGAPIRASGRLAGLDAASDLDITVESELMLPLAPIGQEAVDKAIGRCQRQIRPQGPAAISVNLRRQGGQGLEIRGQVEPKGVSANLRAFSYPMHDIKGHINFDANAVEITQLSAKGDGPCTVDIAGRINSVTHDATYDVNVHAVNMPLNDTLRGAVGLGAEDLRYVQPDRHGRRRGPRIRP